MVQVKEIAKKLELLEEGIWAPRDRTYSKISYPQEGSMDYYKIEEDSFWFNHRNDVLIEALKKFPPGGTVFDIGGGNGYVSMALTNSGIDTILVEPDLDGARNARRRGLNPVICSTVGDAGFTEQSISAVGLFDVLEHLENDVDFLINMKKKLLKKRGRLYLTVPAYRMLWSRHDDCAGHHRRYGLKDLKKKLDLAGYEIEYTTYLFSFLVLPIFLFKTIPGKLGFGKKDTHKENVHNLKSGLFKTLIDFLINRELYKIKRGKKIKYGSSCLVIARSKK